MTSGTGQLQDLSARLWPRLASALMEEVGIDIEFRENGILYPAFTSDEADAMRAATLPASAAGLPVSFLEGAALREAEPALGPAVVAAQIAPGGNVENRRAVNALALANRRAGVDLRGGVHVVGLLREGDRVAGVKALDGDHRADVVVIAAGAWSSQIEGLNPVIPVQPQRGQILALRGIDRPLRRIVMKPEDPYLVPRVDGRIVVGATREFVGFDRSLTAGGIAWLLASAIEMAPPLAGAEIVEMWTGFRPISPDGLPTIGPAALRGLYYATGHGSSGVGPAPATAALLAAQVLARPVPLPPEQFSPGRFGRHATARR